MTAAPADTAVSRVDTAEFDGNAYRKAVMLPMLVAGVVSIEDPFRVIGLDAAEDDVALLRARLVEVVGFWQRERNSPRYKTIAAELVKRRPELEAVLLDDDRRALARMRIQGTRRAQDSARVARIDRLVKAIVARHAGVPRSRLRLLQELSAREGVSPEVLAQRLAEVTILEDGYGVSPLPDTVRLQIRAHLDELALRGDRSRAVSLWSFLGMTATVTTEEVAERHALLMQENQRQGHNRAKTVFAELLAQVKAVLMEPAGRAAYLVVLLAELRERLADRVLELAMVDGELWPADIEVLVREAMAVGTGLSQEQVRQAVRETATGLSIAVTTGKAPEYVVCASCQRQQTAGDASEAAVHPTAAAMSVASAAGPDAAGAQSASGTATEPPPAWIVGSGARAAPALVGAGPNPADDWRQMDREIGQRRLVHALARARRLQAGAPDVTGPDGHLPQQRITELLRQLAEARGALGRAMGQPTAAGREEAVYAVLERVPDLEEAAAALASLPLAGPANLRATVSADSVSGDTVRLTWSPTTSGRTMTYLVMRVTRDGNGNRVEHSLGVTTRCEAVDTGLPGFGEVWHEVTAKLGARSSPSVIATVEHVVADVKQLRAARGPDGVSLTWKAPEGSEVVVERTRLDVLDDTPRTSRAPGSRWQDSATEPGATYRYVVRIEALIDGSAVRSPGCTIELTMDARRALPPVGPERLVELSITPVPPGIVASWEAPPRAEVTVFASLVPLGKTGDTVDLGDLALRARTLGFAVGPGTAFDGDTGTAALITPVIKINGVATLCPAFQHVALGPVSGLRADQDGDRTLLHFDFPRDCGEVLIVWRRDRPPEDAADAEGGEILTAESYALHGGWPVPVNEEPTFLHLLVLPVAHLGDEPVFGPGATLRLG